MAVNHQVVGSNPIWRETFMNKHLQKDLKRRIYVKHFEHRRICLKALQQNLLLPSKIRMMALSQLSKLEQKTRTNCFLDKKRTGKYSQYNIFFSVLSSL